ncbi:MAG: MBOAT family O-acyltransferase [Planctomycetota bacterium]
MLFTSLSFFLFLAVVVAGYFCLRHRAQNLWLLAASYVFYGVWSWRFSLLVLLCTATNFACGALIHAAATRGRKRLWLWVGVVWNLGVLGFFKYYNFFADNLTAFLGLFGLQASWHITDLILPVGISFYTFQALSYTIDVYRGKLEPVRSFSDFALFVAFFPQLVAGPIERATNLLPQIGAPRRVTAASLRSGFWLIFLGVYKKVFVAEELGRMVEPIFAAKGSYAGVDVMLGCALFSLQIYADFAGYTDVARGTARVLGFELMQNFRAPYFASNIQEFWNRWHLSLTTWIKDYMFYPMALSRRWAKILGAGGISLVIMTVIGFWHGASWNFILWGAFHGLVIHAYTKVRPSLYRLTRGWGGLRRQVWVAVCIVFTFSVVAVSEVLFCTEDLRHAWWMFRDLFLRPEAGEATLETLWWSAVVLAVPFVLDLDEHLHLGQRQSLSARSPALLFAVQVATVVSLVQVLTSLKTNLVTPYVYFQF